MFNSSPGVLGVLYAPFHPDNGGFQRHPVLVIKLGGFQGLLGSLGGLPHQAVRLLGFSAVSTLRGHPPQKWLSGCNATYIIETRDTPLMRFVVYVKNHTVLPPTKQTGSVQQPYNDEL